MATRKENPPAQEAVMILRDLEQIRVLADPLRVRILEGLGTEERTTKHVADLLGEKPTKLYHHMEALERVGLIRMTRTRQNRGTLEKYYQGVARRYEADPTLFSESAEHGDEDNPVADMIEQLLGRTAEELGALARSPAAGEIQEKGIVSFCEIRGEEKEIRRIQRRLERLIRDLAKHCEADVPDESKLRRYRLSLAYYPLDRT